MNATSKITKDLAVITSVTLHAFKLAICKSRKSQEMFCVVVAMNCKRGSEET